MVVVGQALDHLKLRFTLYCVVPVAVFSLETKLVTITLFVIDLPSCQTMHIIDLTSRSLSQATKDIQLNPLGSLLII